ncbi:hypothetical protein GCM10008018_29190 [Paenibacillus marchantiophytorum]|uniref:Gfo/Idh/MocA-like oxidoreductase C-terminal domain-containing protein n=1 Tax=Paenibacillus marchantiophytorum TaxID=1619310 RepID=A0ABQ1EQ89_9BACL|nr:hypothetical protein GCM10008018_29190 [Paenibacillus marchantiophytorum]
MTIRSLSTHHSKKPCNRTEFLASLQEGREAETSGRDYLKTQALVHYAKLASETNQTQVIKVPTL